MAGRPDNERVPLDKSLAVIPLIPGTNKTDKVAVRKLYDESPFVEWMPFCESMGWDYSITKMNLPTTSWVREKRYRLAKEHAERLADSFARIKPKINEDIINTLREYPAAHDEFLKTTKAAHQALQAELAEHQKDMIEARQTKKRLPTLRKGFTAELESITRSLVMLTQSKHKSLLLSESSLRAVEDRTNNAILSAEQTASPEDINNDLKLEIIGIDSQEPIRIQEMFLKYLDPVKTPIIPNVVNEDKP